MTRLHWLQSAWKYYSLDVAVVVAKNLCYVILISFKNVTCLAHLTLLGLITP
jgi:hypothetical protein